MIVNIIVLPMKSSVVKWLKIKYDIWSVDAKYKGNKRVFIENFVEFYQKRRFRQFGVLHPHNSINQPVINGLSLNKDANENMPSSFYSIKKAFKNLRIKFRDICLLDIGCGSGRVLSFGMLLKFKNVAGVDLDEKGIQKAIDNCQQLQKKGIKTTYNIQVADASQYDIPEDTNVIYLFNPFGEKTMSIVADNIIKHCQRLSKDIYVVYCNPVHMDVFMNRKECIRTFESFFKNKRRELAIFRITKNVLA